MCKNMLTVMMQENAYRIKRSERETIHSGHFMVSYFDADAQDDEYEVAVPVPEVSSKKVEIPFRTNSRLCNSAENMADCTSQVMSVSIETSLAKLFQCMSIAYRQKLTSPKWNRFKGVRLRWKDKIRLNNVIWRCWHMQFLIKKNTGICQFACPLDVDIHSKPEAVVLEGKYWKRKLNAVTAEYKKWRLFYRNQMLSPLRDDGNSFSKLTEEWNMNCLSNESEMMVDEDYMEFMSDTLFSSIAGNQPFAFPDCRDIARGTNLADLIQPSLVQLQPNLDDFMDTLEPLQDLLSNTSKLPSVPEEYHSSDDLYHSLSLSYQDVATASSTFGATTTASGNSDLYIKDEPDNALGLNCGNSDGAGGSYHEHHQQQQAHSSSNANTSLSVYNRETQSSCVSSSATNYHNRNNNDGSNGGAVQPPLDSYSSCYAQRHNVNSNYSHTDETNHYALNYSQNVRHQVPQHNFTTNTNMTGNQTSSSSYMQQQQQQCYSAEQSTQPSYPCSINNYRGGTGAGGGYSSTSPNYSKLCRSTSVTTNESALSNNITPSADKPYSNQKQLSQHGRSRSGSSLIAQSRTDSPVHNVPESIPSSALLTQLLAADRNYSNHYPYHLQQQFAPHRSVNNSCSNINYDPRNSVLITGHRPVAYCTALIGRRSRTPDHILSGNANPVGYCKPRPPLLSSQCDELINLSNRLHSPHEKMRSSGDHSEGHHHHHSNSIVAVQSMQSRKSSHSGEYANASKNQYQSPSLYHATSSPGSSSSAYSTTMPFIFTATHNPHIDTPPSLLPANGNNPVNNSPKDSVSPSTSECLSLSPLTVGSPMRTTPPSPSNAKCSGGTSSGAPAHYKYPCVVNRSIGECAILMRNRNADVTLKMGSTRCIY